MAIAEYLVELKGQDIDNDTVSCTGNQLSVLCADAEQFFGPLHWFIADVLWYRGEVTGSSEIGYLGVLSSLMKFSRNISHFTEGIFFAAPLSVSSPVFRDDPNTEDERFGNLMDAILEIRAFDGYQFEIYADSRDKVKYFSDLYKKPILTRNDFL